MIKQLFSKSRNKTHGRRLRKARFEPLDERTVLSVTVSPVEVSILDLKTNEAASCACLDAGEQVQIAAIENDVLESAAKTEAAPVAVLDQTVYYVREGASVLVASANEDDGRLRYFWNFSGASTDSYADYREYGREVWLSPDDFNLTAGRRPIRLIVQDGRGVLSAAAEGTLVVQPAQPSFSVSATQSLNGNGITLSVDSYCKYPISKWSIDWGDDRITEVDELGDSITVSHYYADSDEDAVYSVSMIAVDAFGRVCEDVYELTTVAVPAADPISEYLTDRFYDAEKSKYSQSKICWAAGTANVLFYTGWADPSLTRDIGGKEVSFDTEDDVFDYFANTFTNIGSSALYGYEWFITGQYDVEGVSGWAQPDPNTGGFYPEVTNFDDIAKYYSYSGKSSDKSIFTTVASKLQQGWGSTISLAFYSSNPGSSVTLAHTVTFWGFEYDSTLSASDPNYYTGIYISDSDNDAYAGRSAANERSLVNIEWVPKYNRYKLTNYYSGTCWLAEFIALAPKSSVLSAQSTAILDRCFAEYETADAAAILAELNADEEEI